MVAKIKEGLYDGKVKANSLVFRKKQWLLQKQIEPRPDCKALCKSTHHCCLIAHNIVGRPRCIHFHTLLHFVACCWEKFETGQTSKPTTPNNIRSVRPLGYTTGISIQTLLGIFAVRAASTKRSRPVTKSA